MTQFLPLALLVLLAVTVTGFLIAAVTHLAVNGVRRQRVRP